MNIFRERFSFENSSFKVLVQKTLLALEIFHE